MGSGLQRAQRTFPALFALTLLVVGAVSWIWLGQLSSLRGVSTATFGSELISPAANVQDPLQRQDAQAARDAGAPDRSNAGSQTCRKRVLADDLAAADSIPVHPIAVELLFWFGGAICVGIRR